jgi:Fe-S oxidoreductase
LYDYGFLDVAERYLRHTLRELRDEIRRGTPVVGMEPSCVAVFRDELKNLLPHDDDATRLAKNCYHWSEFFAKHDITLPKLDRNAIVWGHCHQKATGGMSAELELLNNKMGMSAREVTGGCCGLAGSFGFETGKYDLSMQCGEIGLLPAARDVNRDTLIIADGFSCKTQLEQSDVGRTALHTAEVMKLARDPNLLSQGATQEDLRFTQPEPHRTVRIGRTVAALAVLGVAAVAGATLVSTIRSRKPRRDSRNILPPKFPVP